jgi:bla regulator protein BlaR1
VSTLATEWAIWMLPVAWQLTLLCGVVLMLDLLLRRVVWPQLLYALWLLVPLCALLPPLSTPVAAGPSVVAPATPPVALFAAWATGVLLFGLLALAAIVRQRKRSRGRPWDDPVLAHAARRLNIRRRIGLVVSPTIESPVVFGLLRPRIVLPDVEMTAAEREHVYLHELAHVKRGDLIVQALYGLVHLVFWFHPLVFVARRRAHGLREVCTDARVASVLRDETPAYRDTLLRFAARLLPQPDAAGFLGGSAVILMRLRWLDRGEWVLSRRKRIATATLLLALAATIVPRAQADIIDPTLASLQAERARLEPRVRELSMEHEGCLELQWIVRRLIQIERESQ